MAYRDRPPVCPLCSIELLRRGRRDIWRCPRCAGIQLAAGELERRLRVLAPDISDEVIRDVMTARRSRAAAVRRSRPAALICPICRRPMHPVAMGGVRVARCDADDQIWLDRAELERLVEQTGVRHQSQRSWLARLFSHLFAT
ncbi:MAG TPA: zf-TFIIB domain-containing protein [Kofleriaceae bacterium]|nr:zf-TFIIB domain-containing protein [Kofleriaceae bacterium]